MFVTEVCYEKVFNQIIIPWESRKRIN